MSIRMSKQTLRVLVLIAVPLAILFFLLPRLIPAERLRDLARDRIAAATGGDVQLGEASIRVFPRLVVTIADGSIAGSGTDLAAATASDNNLQRYRVALRRLEIDVALGPLLRRRVETGKITLIEPDIELVTRAQPAAADGTRAPGAGDLEASGAPVAPSDGLVWGLAVAGVEIRDGHLVWSEAESHRRLEIEGWQQRIAGADLGLLIERLQRFAAPSEGAHPIDEAAQRPASLSLAAECARLTITGFSARTLEPLEQIALQAALTVPAAADRLLVAVEQLRWGSLTATGELEIPAAEHDNELTRWSAALPATDLARLWSAVTSLLPRGGAATEFENQQPTAVAAWLAEGPFTAGSVTVAAAGTLANGVDRSLAERILPKLDLTLRLDDGRLRLPGSDAGVTVAGDAAISAGRLTAANWRVDQPEAGLRAALVVPAATATPTDQIRADLSGELDLAAALAVTAEVLAGTGHTDRARALPRLSGRWEWQASLVAPSLAALADTAAWSGLRTGRGPLALEATGRGREFGLTDGVPGAPWLFPAAEFTWRRSELNLSATGLDHAAVAGKLRLSGNLAAAETRPEWALQLDLERLDLDILTALLRAEQRSAQAVLPHSNHFGALGIGTAYAAEETTADTKEPRPTEAAAPLAKRSPGLMIPPELRLSFTAASQRLILQRAVYTDAFARGTLRQRVVAIPEIAMHRNGGTITGQAQIDYAAAPDGLLNFAAEVQEVPTSALLEPYAPGLAPYWEGSLSGHCSGDCRLGERDTILSSLSVTGLLAGTTGVYHAQELLSGIAPYLGKRQDLLHIRFRQLRKSFQVERGRLIITALRVDGLDTDWLGHGWVGFDGGIDLDLNAKLPAGFTPDLGALSPLAEGLRGDDGRIALDLKLSGRAARPQVTVDLEPLRAAGEQALEDELKKGLGGLLDKLKGN